MVLCIEPNGSPRKPWTAGPSPPERNLSSVAMTERTGAGSSRFPSVRIGAAVAVAVAIAFVAWLLIRNDDSSSTSATTTSSIGPTGVSQDRLRALAEEAGHPIYWAGPKNGMTYELTRTTNGRVFVRYLPSDVPVGIRQAEFTIVGTYPVPGALKVLQELAKKPGETTFSAPHQRLRGVRHVAPDERLRRLSGLEPADRGVRPVARARARADHVGRRGAGRLAARPARSLGLLPARPRRPLPRLRPVARAGKRRAPPATARASGRPDGRDPRRPVRDSRGCDRRARRAARGRARCGRPASERSVARAPGSVGVRCSRRRLRRVRGADRPLRRGDLRRLHQARRHRHLLRDDRPRDGARAQPRRPGSLDVRGDPGNDGFHRLPDRQPDAARDRPPAPLVRHRVALPALSHRACGAARARALRGAGAGRPLAASACARGLRRRPAGDPLRLRALGRDQGAGRRAPPRADRGAPAVDARGEQARTRRVASRRGLRCARLRSQSPGSGVARSRCARGHGRPSAPATAPAAEGERVRRGPRAARDPGPRGGGRLAAANRRLRQGDEPRRT